MRFYTILSPKSDDYTCYSIYFHNFRGIKPLQMKRKLLFLLLLTHLVANAQHAFKHLTVNDGLQNNQIRQIVEMPNGQIFVMTEDVFSLFNGRNFVQQVCNMDSVRPLPSFGGHSHQWQGDTLLWLKDFHSLYMYDVRSKRFRYDCMMESNPVVSRFVTEKGDSMVQAKVKELDHLRTFVDTLTANTTIENNWLQAYLRDRQGGQWFGLRENGILYYPPARPQAHVITPADDVIRRMAQLNDREIIMAGNKGIYIFDCNLQSITKTIAEGLINCSDMAIDSKERIWISTQQGLYLYDHANGTLDNFNTDNTIGFESPFMRFARPLDDGRILVCSVIHTLGYLHPEERRFEQLNTAIPELNNYRTMITACQLRENNKVGVFTQNGAFVLNISANEIAPMEAVAPVTQYSKKHNCVHRDRTGRIWIGTQNGLLLMNGDSIRRLTRTDGLTNTGIQSIAEDADGRIWVATSLGINRITANGNSLQIFPLGKADGIPQIDLIERGACIMSNGQAYFAMQKGLVTFNVRDFNTPNTTATVHIVGLRVMGKENNGNAPLELDYRNNYIEVDFSALNYATPDHTRYRYRLKGLDAEWLYDNEGKGLASARYNALPPGKYTFEAQASIGGNAWGEVTTLSFTINPPIWLTWWAKTLYAIASIAILFAISTVYFRKRKAKLEKENEEKINRLFELRENAHRNFASTVNVEADKIGINIEEEKLVSRIIRAIGENMDNADYTVDKLAADIGMSRASLYSKTQNLLGITPNDFMRNVRLKHAARLLEETDTPVSQISLMVGFQTSRYFSQRFKEMFGVTPSEYRGNTPVSRTVKPTSEQLLQNANQAK